MHVVLAADRRWKCFGLAERIVSRLATRYGRGLRLAITDDTAIAAQTATLATDKLKVPLTIHPTDEALGGLAAAFRNHAMVESGGMVVILHRSLAWSRQCRNLARQALGAGVPVYLIASEDGEPERLKADDARLT